MTRLLQIIFFMWIATGMKAEDLQIYIDGKVNGKPVRFVFDTGSDSTFLFSATAKRLGLNVSDPPKGAQVSPGKILFGKTDICQLDISSETAKVAFAVVDMPEYMTRDKDGALSWSDLNFDFCFINPSYMTVEFKSALPSNMSEWRKWGLDTKSRRLDFDVPGTPKGKGTIAIDTGSPDGVMLSSELWEKWRKDNLDQSSTLVGISAPASGIAVYEICWAKELNIGGIIIRDVPVRKASPGNEYGRQNYLATLGLFALSRLNIIVDKKNGKVYTRPRSDSMVAYPYNRLGAVFVPADMQSQDLIARVAKGSPADKAGVCNGDILMKIDDLDTTKWRTDPSVLPLSRFWEQPTGTKIKLTLKRDSQLVENLVVLEDILGQDIRARHNNCATNQLALLRSQAEEGSAHAQNEMGEAYLLGRGGLAKNDREAVKWFRKAAEQNLVIAQWNMGNAYYTGRGVEKDTAQAVQWFLKAAEQGHVKAQLNMGNCYLTGQGVKKDISQAVMWHRKAAEQNDPQAQYNMGVLCRDIQGLAKDEGEMLKWFRLAADQNYVDSQYNLGVCYQNGQGVMKDEQEAVKWYRKAAEQNQLSAQCNLGVALASGRGVEKDAAEAVKWLRKAAEQNHSNAQYSLGVFYGTEQGVMKNDQEALKWYRKAAEQNHPSAQFNIGMVFALGSGVEKDAAEAVKWFHKAAEQGHAEAQCNLAISFAFGRGVAKDTVEAFAWSCLASANNSTAIRLCNDLERGMSPEEIAAGDRRTRALRSEIEARIKSVAK